MFIIKVDKKIEKGFTLIESLVSIALILIAVTGPLSLTLNSLNTIRQAKNRITASYLAEEIIEDIRAYRDGFVLACKDIDIDTLTCDFAGANLPIDLTLYNTYDGNQRSIAWNLFLNNINTLTDSDIFLSNSSFPFSTLSTISQTCSTLKFDSSYGYGCTNGGDTVFDRQVKLTKISDTTLKIEVEVVYAKSNLFLVEDKTIKVIDYIYER